MSRGFGTVVRQRTEDRDKITEGRRQKAGQRLEIFDIVVKMMYIICA